jgi:hypothetical protein
VALLRLVLIYRLAVRRGLPSGLWRIAVGYVAFVSRHCSDLFEASTRTNFITLSLDGRQTAVPILTRCVKSGFEVSMPSSAVHTFTDPDDYAASIRATKTEMTITGRGQFTAKLTRIDLHRLWMQRLSDNLPASRTPPVRPNGPTFSSAPSLGQPY